MARQHNAKETRELIINSAIELFLEKGYSKTTLEDIVKRVGLTRGAFYWSFNTKRDVLAEIIERYESFYREIYSAYTRSESAYETVKSFLLCDLKKKNVKNPYIQIILYKVEASDQFPELAELQAKLDHEFTAQIEAEIERGQEHGEFRTDIDAHTLTLSLYMSLLGFDSYNASGDARQDGTYFSEEEVDAFAELILSSLQSS